MRRFVPLIILLLCLLNKVAHAQDSQLSLAYWHYESSAGASIVTTGDMDGDSLPEAILGTGEGQLLVLENDGDLLWQFQLNGPVSAIDYFPAVEETAAGLVAASLDGSIILLDQDGELRWHYQVPGRSTIAGGYGPFLLPAITVDDVDGDGAREVAVAGGDGLIYLLNDDGQLRWSYDVGRSLISIATADLDGDGRLEILPGPLRGDQLLALDADGLPIWQVATTAEVGLVQPADTDGDGLAEVILLTAAWDLYVFEGNGHIAWHNDALALPTSHSNPQPGQLAAFDLDGDGQSEILVASPHGNAKGIYTFTGEGRPRWTYLSRDTGQATTIVAGEIASPGYGGLLIAESVQGPLLLLDQDGQLLASYDMENLTGALAMGDLDGNGWAELLAGTESGIQAYGATRFRERRLLWQHPLEGPAVSLALADLDGGGERRVVAGSQSGRVYAFDGRGQTSWDIALGAPVLSLAAGEVDGDGREEIVVSTWDGRGNGQIHLLDSNRLLWSVPAGQPVTALAIGRDGIMAGGGSQSGGFVALLNNQGETNWLQSFPERVTAIGYDGKQLLAGLQSGEIYLVSKHQLVPAPYTLDGPVAALGQGLAVTVGGHLYQLAPHVATSIKLPDALPQAIQITSSKEVTSLINGQIVELFSDELIWLESIQDQPVTMVVGPLNSGGPVDIAIGSDKGRLYYYGWAANQPPLLTEPGLAETHIGYAYSIDVNDPEGDTVTVGLAVWDPSAGGWMEQLAQSLDRGQGRLSWEVPAPFDTWDAGRDSQFHFSYDDGLTAGVMATFEGPAAIAVDPWYLFYGRYVSGVLLVAIAISTVWLLLSRDRARRQSPLGQAENALDFLAADRTQLLSRLSDLAGDRQWAKTVLPHLPALARASEDAALSDLFEGYHLITNHANFFVEGLAIILRSLEINPANDPSGQAGTFYLICCEALQVQDVGHMAGLVKEFEKPAALSQPAFFLNEAWRSLSLLGQASQAFHNYQRVGATEDKVAYLAQAIEVLGRRANKGSDNIYNIEQRGVEQVREHWLTLAIQALRQLQGQAQLELSLRNREATVVPELSLLLDIANEGRGPAYNINLEARQTPGIGLKVLGDSIDQLAAGTQVQVELLLTLETTVPPGLGSEFQIALALFYDDREQEGKVCYFSDIVRLIEVPKEFKHIPNPYAPGKPLRPGSPVFFGRNDILTFVEDNLGQRGNENVIVLAGQRRMGKTSILRQITGRLDPTKYTPVFLDGQAIGFEGGIAGLFYDIAIEIESALADQGIPLAAPSLPQIENNTTSAFEKEFLPMVSQALGKRILVLLLDEFEELEMQVRGGELPRSIFPYLRHLMQHSDQIAFILAGAHRLEELAADHWSALFNIALNKQVSFLDEGAARQLILDPVRPYGLFFDELAVDKMLRVTACHPYFLQLLCYVLVGFHNQERVNYISIKDVSRAMEQVVELAEGHLSLLWADCNLEEKSVLIALSHLLDTGWAADSVAIANQLNEVGISTDPAHVTEIIKGLSSREIVRPIGAESVSYEYKVDLIRLWVERYRPEVDYLQQRKL